MKHIHALFPVFLSAAFSIANAVDGIALSYRASHTDPYGLHGGSIIRHIIRNDTVAADSVIYDTAAARSVCLSPDGSRVAFIRATDGMICVMDINGQTVVALYRVSPHALIDWTNENWIYFTKMFNHITLQRVSVINGATQTIGWFPVGVTCLAVSSDADSVHGIAVLDSGSARYTVATFDYRGFLIYKHAGCIGHISPGGGFYSVGACAGDTASYHKSLSIYAWGSDTASTISAPPAEYIARGNWSVNSDDWLVITVGNDRELLVYHDMMLIKRDMSASIRVTANDTGRYNEACDFWAGNPDSALAKTPQLPQGIRYGPSHQSSLWPNQLNDRHYSLHVYRPDGRHVGRYSDVVQCQKAAISSGLYIVKRHKRTGRCLIQEK